ncbi:uncharacterized protein [Palaemon carinicauda]|uniref:uncharacterized protein n=1 Tax=Palaemon carinicauda TaxID=392227 RepID=UPI0035B62F72
MCRLSPAQEFQWLGIHWSLQSHLLSIPSKNRRDIAGSVNRLLKSGRISRCLQERVLGSLQFGSLRDPVLRAQLKDAIGVWRRYPSNARRDLRRPTPTRLRSLLKSWSEAKYLKKSVPLRPPPPSVIIHTDASKEGWEGHSHLRKAQGTWYSLFKTFHINILGAVAVFFTLKKLAPRCSTHTRLVLDSEVIMRCLNHQGSRSPQINQVILVIFHLAGKKRWHLSAVHLQGFHNVTVDALSRFTPTESEWSLDTGSSSFILRQVPELQNDLFATSGNKKIPRYVAPCEDPLGEALDAMSLDWNRWTRIYLFPPSNLLLKVLNRLRSFQGTAVIVAHKWPMTIWFLYYWNCS